MIVLGVLGGVGSGKSTVAKLLENHGAEVIDADRLGHEVLALPDVISTIKNCWGEQVLDENGWIDRRKLAKIVFSPGEEGKRHLAQLEAITHPRIASLIHSRIASAKEKGVPLVVLDAPVLLKAGWDKICDRILFVDASEKTRLHRVMTRGWTRDDWERRENAQEPISHKMSLADFVVRNEGILDDTKAEVLQVWNAIQALEGMK